MEQLKRHLGGGWHVVVVWQGHGAYRFGCSQLGEKEILTPYFIEVDTRPGAIAEAAEMVKRRGER